jgi:hypothetical protein
LGSSGEEGKPTAADTELDAEAILAAQAITSSGDDGETVIATCNVKQLQLFTPAKLWHDVN